MGSFTIRKRLNAILGKTFRAIRVSAGRLMNLKTYFIHLISFAIIISLVACTGASGGGAKPLPSDGDWVQGNKPQAAFFKTLSSNEAMVVVLVNKQYYLQKITNRQIVSTTPLASESVKVSTDGGILTVANLPGIFELSKIEVSAVVDGTAALPPATVVFHCLFVTANGFDSLDVKVQNQKYSFVEYQGTVGQNAGGPGEITRTDGSRYVSFAKQGYRTLQIDKLSPLQSDVQSFSSNLSGPPFSESLTCHSNDVLVTAPHSLQTLVSSTAAAFSQGGGETNWSSPENSLRNEGATPLYASNTVACPDRAANFLRMTGYFAGPGYSLPPGAMITAVRVACKWYRDPSQPISPGLALVYNGSGAAVDQSQDGSLPIPTIPSLSPAYPSAIAISASDLLSASFGVQIGYTNDNGNGYPCGPANPNDATLYLDYCQVSADWK